MVSLSSLRSRNFRVLPGRFTSRITVFVLVLCFSALFVFLYSSEITEYYEQKVPNSIRIITTAYSSIDSCHFPGCVMANGEKAHVGAVACPRNMQLGTKVKIGGTVYTCKDRYNKNLSDRFDIFIGYGKNAYREAKEYGMKNKLAIILK